MGGRLRPPVPLRALVRFRRFGQRQEYVRHAAGQEALPVRTGRLRESGGGCESLVQETDQAARDEGCRREIQGRDGADGSRSRRTAGAAQERELRRHRLGAVSRRAEFRPTEEGTFRCFPAQIVHPRVAGLQGAAEGQDGRRHPLRLRRKNPYQRLPGILSGDAIPTTRRRTSPFGRRAPRNII